MMESSTWRRLGGAAAVLLACAVASAPAAQTGGTEQSGVAVYRYTELGQTAMTVDLLNASGRSGRYLVEPGLSVLDLIVLSGGAAVSAEGIGGATGTVSVIRNRDGVRSVVYSAPLSEVTEGRRHGPAGGRGPRDDPDRSTGGHLRRRVGGRREDRPAGGGPPVDAPRRAGGGGGASPGAGWSRRRSGVTLEVRREREERGV